MTLYLLLTLFMTFSPYLQPAKKNGQDFLPMAAP
jgi:hypothetical protein